MVDKNKLREEFSKHWEKHYKIKELEERGFFRQQCKHCGRYFWAKEKRDYCGDSECVGYKFIGRKGKELTYIETWNKIKEYFVKNGHTYIESFPTVARWRDDLYFTIASINDFQPYVVTGELKPIANPLIVPQRCIRFPDIDNVGVTGRHFTNFVMLGQHAFNTEETGLFYWKAQALIHDLNYLKELGIKEEEITLKEDVWAGGGNYGPSMEYFVDGLELGNCVFMQYDSKGNELKTKVIDMGAGLERIAWITNGTATAYEVVFKEVSEYLKKELSVRVDKELYTLYAKKSGELNMEEMENANEMKNKIYEEIGATKEFIEDLERLQAIYATADHLLTIMFTTRDGTMPSNAGGGYNLRIILRRVFGFEERYGWNLDYKKIMEIHKKSLEGLERLDIVEEASAIVEEEKKKYKKSMERAKKKVEKIIDKGIDIETLIKLYKSDGISPEMIRKEAKKKGKDIEIPANFYSLVKEKEEKEEKEEEQINFNKTEILYYTTIDKFKAKVIGIINNWLILDKSAFYPESGGQIADTGTINGIKVVDVKKKNGVVMHLMEKIDFKVGEEVEAVVNIERRKRIAKHHTAAHLLNAATREILGKHVWQAGAEKKEDIAHLDITHYKRITDEELRRIEKRVNEYIMMNKPIRTEVLARNVAEERYGFGIYQGGAIPGKELRIVIIEDIDVEACGGTHQMHKTTGEFGIFKIVRRESVQDGIERIVYKVGEAAINYIQEEEELLKRSANIFRVQKEILDKTAERFFNEWKEQKKEIEELKKKNAELIAKNIETRTIIDIDQKEMFEIIKNKDNIIIINREGFFVAKGEEIEFAKRLLEKYGGKAGGNPLRGKLEKDALKEFKE